MPENVHTVLACPIFLNFKAFKSYTPIVRFGFKLKIIQHKSQPKWAGLSVNWKCQTSKRRHAEIEEPCDDASEWEWKRSIVGRNTSINSLPHTPKQLLSTQLRAFLLSPEKTPLCKEDLFWGPSFFVQKTGSPRHILKRSLRALLV